MTYDTSPERLSGILRTLRRTGGRIKAHLVYRLVDRMVGFFLCEHPEEAALALKKEGFEVETETVVTARIVNRPGALSHLVRTLEADGVTIGYSYATATSDDAYVVFRTDDNPRAEDLLGNYLSLPDPQNTGFDEEGRDGDSYSRIP